MSGLYIHIPYCHSKCHYCDFYSTSRSLETANRYIDTLIDEYHQRIHELNDTTFYTIYIGGGTPSILSHKTLRRLLDFLPASNADEITIEVNPEDVTPTLAALLADSPVNRVSMGVQTMDDNQLQSIGRRHSATDAVRAVNTLRSARFSNISLDLIYGLPDQSLSSWIDTLNKTLDLGPTHLSAYSLMLEPGTRLWARLKSGQITETPQELSAEMYLALCEATAANGFQHYEISNFALPGHHSRHNTAYWNLTPYLGIGVSAHSFDGTTRRFNQPNLKSYLSNRRPKPETETLTPSQQIDEYLLLRLRTRQGLSTDQFSSRFGNEALNRLLQKAAPHIKNGTLTLSDRHLSIPEQSWLITDPILIDLFED